MRIEDKFLNLAEGHLNHLRDYRHRTILDNVFAAILIPPIVIILMSIVIKNIIIEFAKNLFGVYQE
ncbi:MAG: hypothetical protein Sv326_0453 [Candidatus Fermentimicrarchaeum limneticum]|uniref:Uncharacterized protein n=1 Tax=Fermentimicrarchaeum limneticum TaxID=2795018 RepID=A0A7D5XLG6_FERL1|nr:MAG: hypothetical protein Sv326_0379 [Candidatus Fermentimicrarchaeum limneticum]QLJ52591.1 MAG: hypothetical protein Sv326_0416 [Candidatus Fermentimicrarchaeum limneticum]QLJ52628.1 MAG: hypothetical protein Sv326_0453 [Candidatus Fermentimicrarchaeum limneticum]